MRSNSECRGVPCAEVRDRRRCLLASLVLLLSLAAPAQQPSGQPGAPVSTSAPPAPAPPLVLIDPAHGGADPGAMLNVAIPEKDVNLSVARRLRQDLVARGVAVQLVREADGTFPADQRAAMANATRPALYLAIHSSSTGGGLTVFSAMLPPAVQGRGPFLDWSTAQSLAVQRSRTARDVIVSAIQKTGFPVHGLIAALPPLNNITVPALAVEIAPPTGEIAQLASNDYQQMICAALANAVAGAMPSLKENPKP